MSIFRRQVRVSPMLAVRYEGPKGATINIVDAEKFLEILNMAAYNPGVEMYIDLPMGSVS